MERYNVMIFPSAQQDLKEVVDYINELSPDAALKTYDNIVESIIALEDMPMRSPFLKNPELRAKGYRVLIVQNYLVFYVVNNMTVEIRRILYGKRRYEGLL
ncbi:MAG: type II toxin-antitoxin system RelE/ParE family toxin [Dethiobacter sp.]|jgi:addiction module RelE/StbE family toxin|nr:type II toxin-antitoxin system RelE/ParE family toxin [Dethiobacter sp.]MBS3901124.1 type II toxin-antitoxin system RelE/ParE family toxin [Dethiobacter sp.]MBS3990078.1 type II toxin-antitoxin system RelE/ParE family toxin [Dethiobacter sp.]